MKENCGNLIALRELGKGNNNSFTTEQLLHENLKNVDGESRKEVTERMEKSFNNILKENLEKRIVIVSHGAAIKFLLMKWCKLNNKNEIQFNKKTINLNSPGIVKLAFEDNKLSELEQIL